METGRRDSGDDPRGDLAFRIVTALPAFGRWVDSISDFETPYGRVGYRQMEVLWILRFRLLPIEHVSPSDLAAHFGVQPSVLTRLLAKLEANGFVRRSADADDARRSYIDITERGLDVSAYVEKLYLRAVLENSAFLDETQVEELQRAIDLLERIMAGLLSNRTLHQLAETMRNP